MRSAKLMSLTLLLASRAFAQGDAARTGCEPIAGLAEVLSHANVLLLGEMHGSNESPAFVGDVVCAAMHSGRGVTVGLEVAVEEQTRFDAFLGSDGGEVSQKALLAGRFWQSATQDGRESRAMLVLLDRLRQMRKSGATIHVVTLDPADPAIKPVERDHRMAERLAKGLREHPQDFVVSLTGNFHNRIHAAPWDATYDFMGKVFAGMVPAARVLSLNVAYSGGSSWICEQSEGCGPRELKGTPAGEPSHRIAVLPKLDRDGYNGTYSVGKLSPAGPAISSSP
jgi:hypothetical protein